MTERVYTLEQIAQAHEHVDGGHKKGNLIIRVAAGVEERSKQTS